MKKSLSCCLAALMSISVVGCSNNSSTATNTQSYKAGTYTATTKGMNGDLTVEVTVDESSIKEVKVTDQVETYGVGQGLPTSPIETLPGLIVEKQSLGIDGVTGATITSNAILKATSDALEQAGGKIDELEKKVEVAKQEDTTLDTDIVVVGAGVAGMSAAIEASEAGAKVVIVEKQGIVGGATTLSGGKLLAAGTSYQEAQGYTGDTPEALYDYLKSVGEIGGEGLIDEAKLHEFTDNALEDVTWLEDTGVPIINVEPIHSSITPWRVMNTKGGGGQKSGFGGNISVPLFDRLDKTDTEIVYNTTANEILTKDGKVCGVAGTRSDGSKVTVNAKKVIIATGGFAQNKDMLSHLGIENYSTSVPKGNVGEGVTMAQAVGADYFESPGVQAVYCSFTSGVGINEESGLIVSDQGKRVVDEWTYQSHVASALIREGSQKAYYIASSNDPNLTVQYALTLEATPKAETAEELAKLIGVDPTTLAETVSNYNAMCAAGEDTEFNKPSEYMIPVEGTLYAIEMNPSFTVTFGGLVTTTNSEVLDTDGNIIDGLYAAGEVANTGLFGDEYPSCGLAIGSGVRFGRIAGQQAVATLSK